MTAAYVLTIVIGAIGFQLSENNSKTGPFVAGFFLFASSLLDLVYFSTFASLFNASIFLFSIFSISKIKYKLTKSTMYYNDILEFDKRVFIDIYRSSKFTFLGVILLLSVLVLTIYFSNSLFPDFEAPIYLKVAFMALGAVAMVAFKKRALKDLQFWNIDARHISTFLVQMIDQKFMRQNLRRLEVPQVNAVPLNFAIGKPAKRPHIILISQESTMPPALYNLPAEPDIAAFFDGDEKSRSLKVEVFGGQTIISIMSALTGLPSTIFGLYRVYAPRLWRGRIHVSLPFFLKQFGYRTYSFVTAESEWMNVGSFYRSIGMDELHEPLQFTEGKHVDLMHCRDSVIFNAAVDHLKKQIELDRTPTFTAIETLGNHAPFDKDIFANDPRVQSTKQWFSKETGNRYSPQMAEYMGRLRASVDDYRAFCDDISQSFPNENFVVVHFGDHQPVWVNQLGPTVKSKHFTTYFAVNYIGKDARAGTTFDADTLPIFNLDLFVADRAGLPLNGYIEQKKWMLDEIETTEFGSRTERFHAIICALRNAALIKEDS
jgi:phosphoglycerol transferase MdoB-like AlkP superfamily enzyme